MAISVRLRRPGLKFSRRENFLAQSHWCDLHLFGGFTSNGDSGCRGDQAAWFAGTSMTSMPPWNVTPAMSFGNRTFQPPPSLRCGAQRLEHHQTWQSLTATSLSFAPSPTVATVLSMGSLFSSDPNARRGSRRRQALRRDLSSATQPLCRTSLRISRRRHRFATSAEARFGAK